MTFWGGEMGEFVKRGRRVGECICMYVCSVCTYVEIMGSKCERKVPRPNPASSAGRRDVGDDCDGPSAFGLEEKIRTARTVAVEAVFGEVDAGAVGGKGGARSVSGCGLMLEGGLVVVTYPQRLHFTRTMARS